MNTQQNSSSKSEVCSPAPDRAQKCKEQLATLFKEEGFSQARVEVDGMGTDSPTVMIRGSVAPEKARDLYAAASLVAEKFPGLIQRPFLCTREGDATHVHLYPTPI